MASTAQENPFEGMKIKDWSVLEKLEGRAICPKCNKSRKYFCYTCYVPVPGLEDHVPKVKLPVKIDIIKHASEIDGKSTAAHAAVIAPDDVTIYTYPCIPDYSIEDNVVLIFPGKNALSIEEYMRENTGDFKKASPEDNGSSEPQAKRANIIESAPISRAVFIDSTWNQSRGIYKDQRLREIPCVVIQSRISQFWRHQHGSPRWFLATIEAVHQFLVEFHIACNLGVSEELGGCKTQNINVSDVDTSLSDHRENKLCHPLPSVSSPENEHKGENTLSHSQDKEIDCETSSNKNSLPDKAPSKFVKNLALCRGIRSDPGGDPGIKLCGPDQWVGKYGGDYDNLLFFFQFMYHKIHSLYNHDNLRSYQREMM